MSRNLAAAVLVLGLAVFGIVRAQERTSSAPTLQPPVLPRDGGVPSRWRSTDGKDQNSRSGPGLASPGSSRARVMPIADGTVGDDGLKSVLKRPSGTPAPPLQAPQESTPTVEAQPTGSAEADEGTESSRRATSAATDSVTEEESVRPIPKYTARTPAGRAPGARASSATGSEGANGLMMRGQAPGVRIETIGPSAISVGKPATYRIVAVNESTEGSREVVVEVGLPANVALDGTTATVGEATGTPATGAGLVWRIPALAGGAREQLELRMTANDDQPIHVSVDWTLRAAPMTASIQVQKPALEVSISGPEDVLYGARQIYTITIANPGTGPAEDVSLDVSTGGNGQARRIGTLAPGAQEQVRMELVAREAGSLEIKATAHGDGLRHEAQRKILVRRAELAVDVQGPGLKFAGSTGTYDVRVENVGNAVASDVEISVKMPAGARFVAGVDGAVETAGRLTWKLKELAAQDLRKYAIEVAYEKAGDLNCEVHAAAAGELASTSQCSTTVEALADLKLVVNDPQGPKAVGEEVVFEIRVVNRGTKAAQGVKVLGQFSEGVEPVRTEGSPAELLSGQVVFQDLPVVEAGQNVTLKIVARADKPGNHRFRAVVKCNDPDTELIAEDMTRFFGDEPKAASTGGTVRR